MLQSINPYNQTILATYEELSVEQIEQKMQKAQDSFLLWRNTSFAERKQLVLQLADLLLAQKATLAKQISLEIGKPIAQSLAEIEKCAWLCTYYAEISEKALQDKIIETDAQKSFVRYNPLGVVLAIMPWNYPFWQYFRFIIPNIMLGNVGVLKHASNVCACALAIEKLFDEAGFPANVSTTFLVSSAKAHYLVAHPLVQAVSLTGSEYAGAKVAELSGKHIKKTVLELGGNNALIVFEDADIEQAVHTIVNARYQNSGQSCIAGKRLLLHQKIADKLLIQLKKRVEALRFGDPLNPKTEIGVLAKEKFAIELEQQMQKSIAQGAKLYCGGKRNKAFFEPSILCNVNAEMEVFQEETFGALLAVSTFSTEAEAVALSNKSKFGLGVSIFTQDKKRINRLINLLDEGAVFVNELVKSDPRLPFGGIKKSGYGRELSTNALFEFANAKTVYIR